MKNITNNILFSVLAILLLSSHSIAVTDIDDTYSGIEVDEVITLGSSLLATALFIFSYIAYKRDGRRRLLYVTIAFFLFAVKGFLSASELFFPERDWVDPVASFLDFAILLSFFFGLLKK